MADPLHSCLQAQERQVEAGSAHGRQPVAVTHPQASKASPSQLVVLCHLRGRLTARVARHQVGCRGTHVSDSCTTRRDHGDTLLSGRGWRACAGSPLPHPHSSPTTFERNQRRLAKGHWFSLAASVARQGLLVGLLDPWHKEQCLARARCSINICCTHA